MSGFPFNSTGDVAGLAKRLCGEPNTALSTVREMRFGRRGSLVVALDRGVFADHEAGVGGGMLDLAVHLGIACNRAEAARLIGADMVFPRTETVGDTAYRERVESDHRQRRVAVAAKLWAESEPLAGSIAETYLRHARAITAPLSEAIRFLARAPFAPLSQDHRRYPAMVAAVVDADGRTTGAHLTFLHVDGSGKAAVTPSRKMVGAVKGAHIPLIPGPRLIVGEGIESALSAWSAAAELAGVQVDGLGAVAGLSAGGVAALVWPRGTTALLIAPDRDPSGAGDRAALGLARRAHAAGLGVAFLRPPEGVSDWNEAAQAERVRS